MDSHYACRGWETSPAHRGIYCPTICGLFLLCLFSAREDHTDSEVQHGHKSRSKKSHDDVADSGPMSKDHGVTAGGAFAVKSQPSDTVLKNYGFEDGNESAIERVSSAFLWPHFARSSRRMALLSRSTNIALLVNVSLSTFVNVRCQLSRQRNAADVKI